MALFFTFNIGSAFAYTEFSDYTVNYETSGPWGAGYYLNCPSNLGDGDRKTKNGNNFPLTSTSGWSDFNTGSSYCNNANWGAKGVQLNAIGFYCSVGTPSDIVFINTGNSNYAMIHCDASGVMWKASVYNYVPPDYTSRIDSISVSTTTGKVNIRGYWNATTTTGIYQQLEFYQESTLLGQEAYSTVNATTSGAFDLFFDYRDAITPYAGTSTMPITAKIDFFANLYQKDNNYYNPFGEYDVRYSTLLDATTTSLTASTTNAWEFSTTTSVLAYPEYECAITSLTGCFKNAIIWTFYPTADTIARYNSLVELIQKKPPIGYFTIVKSSIGGLSATSTSAFNITIPAHLQQYIFSPVDIGIASILWIYFVFMFYKRLKHIQI